MEKKKREDRRREKERRSKEKREEENRKIESKHRAEEKSERRREGEREKGEYRGNWSPAESNRRVRTSGDSVFFFWIFGFCVVCGISFALFNCIHVC